MEPSRLKAEIDQGRYRPQPERVAQAMLQRRGVRALLIEAAGLNQADRIRPAPPDRRRAA